MVRKIPKTAARAAGKAAEKAAETLSAAGQLFDSKHLAANVRDSAQQIWLAGMGAFSRAQAEGGKVFETLIKEGMHLQRKTQGLAEDKIHEVTGKVSSMAGDVQAKAGQQWDKLETIFEQRTAKAMAKLGVPTAQDIETLIKRVDELAAAVARLSGEAAPKAARKAVMAAKPAARKTSAAPSAKKQAPAPAAVAPARAPRSRKKATTA
ncbi:MAG: phasin family protein [Rubrivivax sp.]|jgi:poly(hydroxyalkanoate) granule-associated protein|nr:phasin family protein [Rubrivivax sp.]